jgi:hypothetical protein
LSPSGREGKEGKEEEEEEERGESIEMEGITMSICR